MQIGLAADIDQDVSFLLPIICDVESQLNEAIGYYGKGLDAIFIGVIVVNIASPFHTKRRFKFDLSVPVRQKDGSILSGQICASIDTKFDPDKYKSNQDSILFRSDLARAITTELVILKKHTNKYPDFDIDQFLADIEVILERLA